VTDPDGARWEWYVKTGDADRLTDREVRDGEASCCAPAAAEPVALGRAATAGSECC